MKYSTACILAAGMGGRLQLDHPKGFLTLGERPIVEESLIKLFDCGVERVVLVTGYAAEYYQRLAANFPDRVQCVHNPEYADSGSLYSLWCAHHLLDGPYLLLESDLIYESRALSYCQEQPVANLVLLSDFTQAGDEVYVEVQDGCLVDMNKQREQLGPNILGEFVGICKVSARLHQQLVGQMEASHTLRLDYEVHGLVTAAQTLDISCQVIPDLIWAEIDDEQHLERARRVVYPRLIKRGQST